MQTDSSFTGDVIVFISLIIFWGSLTVYILTYIKKMKGHQLKGDH